MKKQLLIFSVLLFCTTVVQADDLLITNKSWDGGDINYPEGEAEITSVILNISPNDTPIFHCHPTPTLGYVLEGNVEVETIDGKKTILKEGHSIVEVMRTIHKGKALERPARIVVFYAGAKGIPNTVFTKDTELAKKYCD